LLITQVLKQANLVPSTTEAQRTIEQGGVKIDGEKVADRGLRLKAGSSVVIQVGKRKFARVRLT
jgi:tyrosyl-tRNA synthetase